MLAPDYMWRRWVGNLGYRKTGMGLVLLRELILGPERFDTAFREYIDRWAFKSPRPDDFFRSMEDSAGMDLGWFWKGWFLGTGAADFAVTNAELAEDGESGLQSAYAAGCEVVDVTAMKGYPTCPGLQRAKLEAASKRTWLWPMRDAIVSRGLSPSTGTALVVLGMATAAAIAWRRGH